MGLRLFNLRRVGLGRRFYPRGDTAQGVGLQFHQGECRVGGGTWRKVGTPELAREEEGANQLTTHGDWIGQRAGEKPAAEIARLLGNSVADSTRQNYNDAWINWTLFRKLRNRPALLNAARFGSVAEEDELLTFAPLLTGPTQRAPGAIRLELQAVSHHREIYLGGRLWPIFPALGHSCWE